MLFQEFAPVALIPLRFRTLIPFGQILMLGNSAQMQVASATNRSIIVGNAAPVTTGAQTARPTNVNSP